MKREDGKKLVAIRKALEAGERLSDEQVAKLAELRRAENAGRRFLPVRKVELRAGEELHDFIWAMISAVETNRVLLADGSLDAWLEGIFNDHVIVRDGNTGKLFRANFRRAASGEIEFEEPVEVRVEFVPVGGGDVEKAAPTEVVELELRKSRWGAILGSENALRAIR